MPENLPSNGARYRFGAVILAAGGSSRMGSAKQLLMLGGVPLVVRAVDAALASAARPVVVVLGSRAERVRAPISGRPVLTVLNPDWKSGMASSIRAGVAALLGAEPEIDAVLVAPCDQPALSAEVIDALAALHRASGRVAATRFCGRNGAPAVFGRGHFERLLALSGDEGARSMLNAGAHEVSTLELPEMALDLDTPADVRRWAGGRE
jgi:molybdenum cofactor cytidylyltransferase